MSKSWTKEELAAASKAMKDSGNMSYEEFCESLEENKKPNKYWIFLEDLRRSGEVNMFGVAPYLAKRFNLTMIEARKILVDWMENYNREDYEGAQ